MSGSGRTYRQLLLSEIQKTSTLTLFEPTMPAHPVMGPANNLNTTSHLTTREVYQVLKDIALGTP
jgi:hypothetical protein